jgi:hypothetical protein
MAKTPAGFNVMAQHRALAPLMTLLAIATGATLFATGWTLSSPAVADPRPFATEQVVREFYAAINLGIRTGDTTLVETIVLEDGVVHGGLATLAPDRAGLTRYVKSLHATAPQLELSVVDIFSAGDRSLVDIALAGADESDLLGSPIPDIALWGQTDALRVSDRKVVEFWSGANGMALFEPLAQATFAETVADRSVALDRLTILPGESFVAEGADESRWLYVESGQLTISTIHLERAPSIWAKESDLVERSLVPDDFVSVAIWRRTELRNAGREQASLLVLAADLTTMAPIMRMAPPGMDSVYPQGQSTTDSGRNLPSWWPGVQKRTDGEAMVKSLAGNVLSTLPVGEWSLTVARVTLAPRSVYSVNDVEGMHLMTVSDGSLEFSATVRDGYKSLRHVEAGAGALLDLGTVASLTNVGADPVVFTTVAILPAEA